MDALLAEFGHSGHIAFPVVLSRMLLATFLGAAIGFEREWRSRPAGLRTHALICLAAATFGILTIEIVYAPMFQTTPPHEELRVDPLRVIEAVTAGVAFLAAGTIVLARGQVHGLTTGAGMWLAGAIGLACGLGYWKIALIGTALTVLVLVVLYRVELGSGSSKLDPAEGSPEQKQPAA